MTVQQRRGYCISLSAEPFCNSLVKSKPLYSSREVSKQEEKLLQPETVWHFGSPSTSRMLWIFFFFFAAFMRTTVKKKSQGVETEMCHQKGEIKIQTICFVSNWCTRLSHKDGSPSGNPHLTLGLQLVHLFQNKLPQALSFLTGASTAFTATIKALVGSATSSAISAKT